jgi:hypothetical protein
VAPFGIGAVKPYIDTAFGDAESLELRTALLKNDWRPAEGALARTTDPSRYEFLVDTLSNFPGRPAWVDAWPQAVPASAAARMVWGSQTAVWAWEARSSAPAENVRSDAWEIFFQRLRMAEEQLNHATAMAPASSAPWVTLMKTGIGLEVGQDELRRRYAEIASRNPESEPGARTMLTALSRKWGGSHEAMWTFVHDTVGQAVEGSSLHMLIPMGHIEAWLGDRMKGDSPIHHSRYFEQPAVQDEIRTAHRNYFGGAHQPSPFERANREWFAVSFYLMRDFPALRAELEKIGPGIQRTPFGYLGGPLASYQAVLDAAKGR